MNYEFCNGYTYTIKQGDTLYEISKKLEVPLALILRANPYVDVFNLQIGDTLCIPARERPLPPLIPPPGRPEPGRPEPGRPQPGRPQPGRPEPGRPEPGRPEPGRPEPGRPEPGRPEPGRPQPGRPEPGRPQPDRPLPPETPPQPGRPQPEPGSGRPLPPLPPPPNMRMSEDVAEEDAWIRCVVQPGDTMSELLKDQDLLQMFIERNGLENIYLLPGVAYYVPER